MWPMAIQRADEKKKKRKKPALHRTPSGSAAVDVAAY